MVRTAKRERTLSPQEGLQWRLTLSLETGRKTASGRCVCVCGAALQPRKWAAGKNGSPPIESSNPQGWVSNAAIDRRSNIRACSRASRDWQGGQQDGEQETGRQSDEKRFKCVRARARRGSRMAAASAAGVLVVRQRPRNAQPKREIDILRRFKSSRPTPGLVRERESRGSRRARASKGVFQMN